MKKWSLSFRLWHWLNTFVIFGLLATVFLRKTFLSWKANSQIIAQKLAEFNIDISAEQAKAIAKAIRAPMWDWHIILGYALTVLIIWRGYLFFTNSGKRVFKNIKEANFHKKIVNLGYIPLYLVIFLIVVSGLVLNFEDSLSLSKELAHSIKEAHEFFYTIILIFVPLHIAGVIMADATNEPCITSDMINGGKE